MNTFLKLLSIATIFLLVSCGDDDSTSDPAPGPTYADQDIQGTHNGESWSLKSGSAVSVADPTNIGDYLHVITLRSVADTNICSRTFNGNLAYLSLPGEKYLQISYNSENEIIRTGDFALDGNESEGDAAFSFVEAAANGASFTGFTGGMMEITTVDTATGVIEGRIVASDDNFNTNSSVNGNFTADYCRE